MCFDYGFGPFRWVCTSGDPGDLQKTDSIALAGYGTDSGKVRRQRFNSRWEIILNGSLKLKKTDWWLAPRQGYCMQMLKGGQK